MIHNGSPRRFTYDRSIVLACPTSPPADFLIVIPLLPFAPTSAFPTPPPPHLHHFSIDFTPASWMVYCRFWHCFILIITQLLDESMWALLPMVHTWLLMFFLRTDLMVPHWQSIWYSLLLPPSSYTHLVCPQFHPYIYTLHMIWLQQEMSNQHTHQKNTENNKLFSD
jgi:hypothetical protein